MHLFATMGHYLPIPPTMAMRRGGQFRSSEGSFAIGSFSAISIFIPPTTRIPQPQQAKAERERQSGSWSTVKPSRCAIRLSGTTYRPVPCHRPAGRHQSVATFQCKLFFFDFSLSVQLPIRSRRYLISEVIPNDCFNGARGACQHPRYRLQRVAAGDISVVSF